MSFHANSASCDSQEDPPTTPPPQGASLPPPDLLPFQLQPPQRNPPNINPPNAHLFFETAVPRNPQKIFFLAYILNLIKALPPERPSADFIDSLIQ